MPARPGVMLGAAVAGVAGVALLAGCGGSSSPATTPAVTSITDTGASVPATTTPAVTGPASATSSKFASRPASAASSRPGYSKVLVIPMENKTEGEVIGSPQAPYLTILAGRYGTTTNMNAGYPAACPSLAAYLLMTSGSTHGVCDDADPKAHPIGGSNLFQQVAQSGREWRNYAESMPSACAADNSADGLYLVRHAPAPYYVSERGRCPRWDVPLGSRSGGALHDDVAAGRLPAYAMATPNACDDMHGAAGCSGDSVRNGDDWMAGWLPQILAGPDYTAGRLVIIITWDEGNSTDNHIPTLVISPSTSHVAATRAYTQCSTLRTVEELLALPLLGCAADAPSLRPAFNL